MLSVEQPGLLTTLQDAGRAGSAHLGIGRGGAADLPAMRLANALVGNAAAACVLEATLTGPTLVFHHATRVALTGAPLPKATLDGRPVPMWQTLPVAAGQRLVSGPMAEGCRTCLAVAGGIDIAPWRGSRATDVNAGLGPLPRPLMAGDNLPTGRPCPYHHDDSPAWSLDPSPWFDAATPRRIRLLEGSHADALDAASRDALTSALFTTGNDSNRVGMRLDGPVLHLRRSLELVSEGLVPGVVQLPPDGRPIIMGPEHPVTGGYPRIAQVAAVDLPILAQCRPGDTLRFAWIGAREAAMRLARHEAALATLVARIGKRLERT